MRLLVTVLFLVSGICWAQEEVSSKSSTFKSTSEIQSTPSVNEFRFLAAPTYTSNRREVTFRNNDGYTREFNGSAINFGGDYGITDSLSVGASSSVGEGVSKYSDRDFQYHSNGLSDLLLKTKLALPSHLLLGVGVSLSPDQQILSTGNTSGNRYSGGHSLIPSVSYENYIDGKFILGGEIVYSILGKRNAIVKNKNGKTIEDIETSGGNIFSMAPYLEFRIDNFALGLQERISFIEGLEEKSSLDEPVSYDSYAWSDTILYSVIKIQNSWELIPKATYGTILQREIDNVRYNYYDNFNVELMGRYTF